MEFLSIAYVSAVAAHAGMEFKVMPGADFGVDGSLHALVQYDDLGTPRRVPSGARLDCQLKATTDYETRGDKIVYALDASTHRRIVTRREEGIAPIVLLLFCMPKARLDWLRMLHEDELHLRHCCYFYSVEGEPTPNKSQTTIYIPRENRVSSDTLWDLVDDVRSRWSR